MIEYNYVDIEMINWFLFSGWEVSIEIALTSHRPVMFWSLYYNYACFSTISPRSKKKISWWKEHALTFFRIGSTFNVFH